MNNTDNLDKLNTVHEAGIDEAAVSDGAAVQGLGFSDTEIKGAIEALLFVRENSAKLPWKLWPLLPIASLLPAMKFLQSEALAQIAQLTPC